MATNFEILKDAIDTTLDSAKIEGTYIPVIEKNTDSNYHGEFESIVARWKIGREFLQIVVIKWPTISEKVDINFKTLICCVVLQKVKIDFFVFCVFKIGVAAKIVPTKCTVFCNKHLWRARFDNFDFACFCTRQKVYPIAD